MDKKKIKELFHYAIQDPKKWVYNENDDNVRYIFSNYKFIYNNQKELFFNEKDKQFTKSIKIYAKHPITVYPFLLPFWKNEIDITPPIFLLMIILFTISLGIAIFSLIILLCVAIINLFGTAIPYDSNIFIYSSILYPITYILYTVGWYFFNKQSIKMLKILDLMRNKEKKIVYENKIEKENENFKKLVEEHFKKQSRKAKLEQIIEDGKR